MAKRSLLSRCPSYLGTCILYLHSVAFEEKHIFEILYIYNRMLKFFIPEIGTSPTSCVKYRNS